MPFRPQSSLLGLIVIQKACCYSHDQFEGSCVHVQFAGDEAQQAKQREAVQKCLEPLRKTLQSTKWLGGKSINYADISVAGTFMVSPLELHGTAHLQHDTNDTCT